MTRTFDYTPLNRAAGTSEIMRGLFAQKASWLVAVIIGILLVVVPVLIVVPTVLAGRLSVGGGVLLAMLFGGGVWVIDDVVRQVALAVRLRRFAEANGFELIHDSVGVGYRGSYFSDRRVLIANAIRDGGTHFLEWGNIRFVGRQERSSAAPTYGYVRSSLPRRLPHMMLKAHRNRMELPDRIDRHQTLSLEGDWDKHFTLYVPAGYETDALYVFTPDVMVRFIDVAGQFNCEIVDDELYLFADKRFRLTSRHQTQAILALMDGLMPKFEHQIDHYADARVGDRAANAIAVPGKRLRQRSWLAAFLGGVCLLGLAAVLVVGVLNVIGDPQSPVWRLVLALAFTLALTGAIAGAKMLLHRRKS